MKKSLRTALFLLCATVPVGLTALGKLADDTKRIC